MGIVEKFNSGFNLTNQKLDIRTSSVEGRDDGLNIGIFPLVDNNQYMVTWEYGMIVFIHNSQFKPLLTPTLFTLNMVKRRLYLLNVQSHIKPRVLILIVLT